jgi:hypothetical protein
LNQRKLGGISHLSMKLIVTDFTERHKVLIILTTKTSIGVVMHVKEYLLCTTRLTGVVVAFQDAFARDKPFGSL